MKMIDFQNLTNDQKAALVENQTLARVTDVEFPIKRGMLICYRPFDDNKVRAVYPVSSSLWPYCKTCQTHIVLGVSSDGKYTLDNTSCHDSMWINNPPVFVELDENAERTTFADEIAKMF